MSLGSRCTGLTYLRLLASNIGETEKNLHRVFDAAEDSGALLLFDEVDALFGRMGLKLMAAIFDIGTGR